MLHRKYKHTLLTEAHDHILITCGFSPWQKGFTPMHWAAQNGHEVVVATLLAAGATSKAEDQVTLLVL